MAGLGWRGTCGRLIYRGQSSDGGGTAAARGMRRSRGDAGRWWGPRSTSFRWQLRDVWLLCFVTGEEEGKESSMEDG